MENWIELYRAIIPTHAVINDNAGTHYRAHQAKLEWLTNQFNNTLEGRVARTVGRGKGAQIITELYSAPGSFVIPPLEEIKEKLGDQEFISIRCEVWRCKNTRFDPQNYAKTFKAPIDLLVANKYIEDDNWNFVDGITYCGGGEKIWQRRAIRFENDGLPDELTPQWWKQHCSEDYNDILIRILIK